MQSFDDLLELMETVEASHFICNLLAWKYRVAGKSKRLPNDQKVVL